VQLAVELIGGERTAFVEQFADGGKVGGGDGIAGLADAIEKRVAAATAQADTRRQAILAKAFRGELVPTEAELARREGRDYEPASVLLERIRAERKGREAPSKGVRRDRRRAKGAH
jgi:hypothetical protein